jgi:hypothetical protein
MGAVPLDPAVRVVNYTKQPPVVVDAMLQGIRPQLDLHTTVVKTQQRPLENVAREVVRRAAGFYVEQADRGELPVDPARLESRLEPTLAKVHVLPPRERAAILDGTAPGREDLILHAGLAHRSGSTLLSTEQFLRPSGEVNFPYLVKVAAHETGHHTAGRAAVVDERGCATVASGIGFRYSDAEGRPVNTGATEEPAVDNMCIPAAAAISERSENEIANLPGYRATWDVYDLQVDHPELYRTAMRGFFDNGAHGDVDRFLRQKQQSLVIMQRACSA